MKPRFTLLLSAPARPLSNPDQAIDGGDIATWLAFSQPEHVNPEKAKAAHLDTSAHVPCGDCTACCRARYFIHVQHNEPAVGRIPADLLFPAPGKPDQWVMGFDEQGRCPMLVEETRGADLHLVCSIYDDRPQTCRDFDCRVFTITGVDPEEAALADIRARTLRWHMLEAEPMSDAALLHLGAQNAARFLAKHADQLGDLATHTSTQRAVIAVQLAPVFTRYLTPLLHKGMGAQHPLLSELVRSIRTELEQDRSAATDASTTNE